MQTLGSRLRSPSDSGPTVFIHNIQLTPQLDSITRASREAILDSLAPRTLSAYFTGWDCFKSFHFSYQLPFPSTDVLSICNFITHAHSVQKIPSSTIQTYLAGIRFILKLVTGHPCSSISHSHVTMLIKGLRKREPLRAERRSPLTTDLLTLCIRTLRSGYMSPAVDLTLESMFLLAFFGFLRCSEFAPTSSRFDPSRHPRLSDITIYNSDSLIYTLRISKTDQLGISFPIYIFRLNTYLSPFEPIARYTSSRYTANASPSQPLFITETGHMATRFWFQKHFRNILRMASIPPTQYSCHSFRIGAATSAARLGISDQTIQVLGRWSSQAYRVYIRNNLNNLRLAHTQLGSI